jgi:hypothetical protein
MSLRSLAAAFALLAAPAAVRAADHTGFAIDLRVGYAAPMGDAAKGDKLSDDVQYGIPLRLDLGYRFTNAFSLALYLDYAFDKPKGCPSGVSCSAGTLGLGLEGFWHFTPDGDYDVWAGAGIGAESSVLKATGSGIDTVAGIAGIQFPLQVGVDFPVGALSVGPFLGLTVAQYNKEGVSTTGGTPTLSTIPDKAWHEWLVIGVRGNFRI